MTVTEPDPPDRSITAQLSPMGPMGMLNWVNRDHASGVEIVARLKETGAVTASAGIDPEDDGNVFVSWSAPDDGDTVWRGTGPTFLSALMAATGGDE